MNEIVSFGDLVGSRYHSESMFADKCVIVAIGAPTLGDRGDFAVYNDFLQNGYDVIIPDYYGFCRSKGKFTPKNCIKTLLDTKKTLKNGIFTNIFSGEKRRPKYKHIAYLGLSFGGGIVSVLPSFDIENKKIGVFYPVLDFKSLGKVHKTEHTVADFYKTIKLGFSPIYRGINLPVWEKYFLNKTKYNITNQTKDIGKSNLFFVHGTADNVINYENTRDFFSRLKSRFPKKNLKYKEYKNKGHGSETLKAAVHDFINRLKK